MRTLILLLLSATLALAQEYNATTVPQTNDKVEDSGRKTVKILNDSRTGANALRVTVSGTSTFAQSGTSTVVFPSAQPVTGSSGVITISGTPTFIQGGTATTIFPSAQPVTVSSGTLTLSGTPTVTLSGTPTFTQTGTSTVIISGTPTFAQSGTSTTTNPIITSGTPSTYTATTASGTCLAANANRLDAAITNTGTSIVYLSRSGTAIVGSGIPLYPNGGAYNINATNLYRGVIAAITASGSSVVSLSQGQ